MKISDFMNDKILIQFYANNLAQNANLLDEKKEKKLKKLKVNSKKNEN